MSSNQPVLPHVIIALNASENYIDESQWDPDTATSSILESLSRTVFKNATFKKYAQFWRERQRQIESVEQLILSYYSSIRVVRIPTQGRPPLIQTQIGSLYTGITIACEIARDRKTELRIRGIVELEILRSIEETLGNGLRIQNFFDLIVGTSTGGLVALGLVSRNCARATSAAPRYFRPFVHEASKQIYMDGALYHNNPVRIADTEWKLIWNRGPTTHPDIMLSLGTGSVPDQDEKSLKSPISKRGLIRNGRMLLKIATDHVEDALDCEKTWRLDGVKALEPLQAKVVEKLLQDAISITGLAFQLVATCFYYDVERVQQSAQNTATATGRLYCRFADGSLEIQELGKLIRDRCYREKNPFFLVREKGINGKSDTHSITSDVIGAMINLGKFTMRKMKVELGNKLSEVEIYLYLNDEQRHLISGFPRCLFDDEQVKTSNQHSSMGRKVK
ncbi:hypothetical protein N0V95_003109 [Ascochyta clinopodiicola]|nr:hypothetical protein N0V95_003109 [Ascochyta clinopodiicola]